MKSGSVALTVNEHKTDGVTLIARRGRYRSRYLNESQLKGIVQFLWCGVVSATGAILALTNFFYCPMLWFYRQRECSPSAGKALTRHKPTPEKRTVPLKP